MDKKWQIGNSIDNNKKHLFYLLIFNYTMSEKSTADNNNKRNALPKNIEELRRLKMEKKEAKRKLNEQQKSKPPQAPPPKPLLRQFKDIPYSKVLSTVSGTLRIMSFNVSV